MKDREDEEHPNYRPKRLKKNRKTNPGEIKTLNDLLGYFRIKRDDWDMLIVGDGSGTTWDRQFGWGSVLVDRTNFKRELFFGGMSHGTNNMAEIMAVLHPLMWLTSQKKGVRTNGLQVHVISDSTYVVRGLRVDDPMIVTETKANRDLWMAVEMAKRCGITLTSHFIPRDTIDFNKLSHDLANIARRKMIGVLEELKWDVQKISPEE